MNMTCDRFAEEVDRWSRGAHDGDVGDLIRHARSCRECGIRYNALLPLLARDAGILPARNEGAASRVSDAVMEKIGGMVAAPPARRDSPARWAVPAMVAACAIFLLLVLPRIESRMVEVRFVLMAPSASSVTLVGDFGAWEGREMRKLPSGEWELKVSLERGRAYSYGFMIDGNGVVPDPFSDAVFDDGFGGKHSSLAL